MKIAAAQAIAGMISDKDLTPDSIVPKGMDFRVPPVVAAAVAHSAIETGVAKIKIDPELIAQ
jgi:malate dehydrogenase (oxaloacetate-decarboxylating)